MNREPTEPLRCSEPSPPAAPPCGEPTAATAHRAPSAVTMATASAAARIRETPDAGPPCSEPIARAACAESPEEAAGPVDDPPPAPSPDDDRERLDPPVRASAGGPREVPPSPLRASAGGPREVPPSPLRASAGGPRELPPSQRGPGAPDHVPFRGLGAAESAPRPPRAAPMEALQEAKAALRDRARRAPILRLDSSDFSCDLLRVRGVHGREAIGQLFSYDIDVVCSDGAELSIEQVLGAAASLVFEVEGADERTVYGMIAEVEDRHETETAFRSYRLRLAPRAFRATLVELQQVFLDISVPELIQHKLAMVGLGPEDMVMRLYRDHPRREMIVQYKETDLAFISRLAEHLGISFFFEHESGRDVMVFTDEPTGFQPLPGGDVVVFRPRGERRDVFELREQARAFPATYVMQEYNYRTPRLDMTAAHESPAGLGGGVVEYGAHHKTPEEGQQLARIRAEERASSSRYFECQSDELRLIPGAVFALAGHPRLDGERFLAVEVEHRAVQPVAVEGGAGGEQEYVNRARLVRAAQAYRPPRTAPRPKIHGVVTALVEPLPDGEIGEVSPIDEQGRYRVRFHFDAGDPASRAFPSRLVRMIQPHAGPNYGIHFPLKPGIEVLMVFVDGDPDRPMIVGAAPNPITPSPVTREVNLMHRIETSTGILIEMRDCAPRG
ncbi:type VI secretion system Vgr family protein [Sorangium cellulosum]|uniref:type VI secretion system Vgr family protein n=1 Tax=Sorangium cellulosum TaxID=56 RepID=UPI0002E2DD11|nr:type VI secretion system tip protein TssI/VgrG [Sorangium cellulosum]